MSSTVSTLVFEVVPYLAIAVFVLGHAWRWRHDQMGWTTHTSQLLENRLLRLASPLFHLGALGVVGGHVIGLLIPAGWTEAVGISEHAYHMVAVGGGTVTGLMLAVGFVLLVIRRRMTPKVFRATTRTDKLLYAAMGWMIVLGMAATVGVNIFGAGYDYREELAVWFRQIFWLQPDAALMADAPLVYQLHAVSGFLFLALWPFTRLVHVWSAPLAYLWRPYVVYRGRPGNAPAASPRPADVRDSALPR